jgi:hypothetical protein
MCAVLAEMARSSMHASEWERWRSRWNAADGTRPEVLRQATAALEAWCPRYEGWRKRAFPADGQQRHTDWQPAGEPPLNRPYHRLANPDLCVLVRAGDDRAFERLLLRHWYHVRYVIRGIEIPGEGYAPEWVGMRWKSGPPITLLMRAGVKPDNVSQLALEAFWTAALDFEPNRGCGFRTFASKRIRDRLFSHCRNANRKKHRIVTGAARLNEPIRDQGADEGERGPLSDILIAVEGPEGAWRAVDPLRAREINEPEELAIRHETWQEILKLATPLEREVIDARLNGEPLDDAGRQALYRLRRKLRHVLVPNGGYIGKAKKCW